MKYRVKLMVEVVIDAGRNKDANGIAEREVAFILDAYASTEAEDGTFLRDINDLTVRAIGDPDPVLEVRIGPEWVPGPWIKTAHAVADTEDHGAVRTYCGLLIGQAWVGEAGNLPRCGKCAAALARKKGSKG